MTLEATGTRTGTVTIDGAPIAYDVAGQGPAVALLHAGFTDRRMWDPQWAALGRRHTVVRHDLRGFGGSPDAPGNYSHHGQLLALLDHLGIEEVALVGASLGAYVGLCAAAQTPRRVRQLVLLGPVLDGVPPTAAVRKARRVVASALDRGDVTAAVETNLRTWFDGPRRRADEVDGELRRWVGQMHADVLSHAHAGRELPPDPPMLERLPAVTCPTTLVTGTLDQRWVLDCADRIAARVPDVRLHAVDGTAHLPSIEAAERVTILLDEILLPEGA